MEHHSVSLEELCIALARRIDIDRNVLGSLKDSRRNDIDCSVTCLGTCMLADFSVCSLGISMYGCDGALVVGEVE